MVDSFIGNVAPLVCNIWTFMRYLSDKLETIGKVINNVADRVDSIKGILPQWLRRKENNTQVEG
jgi:hypothetical protein